MAFSWTTQKRSHIPGIVVEAGRVTVASVSGYTFSVPTKLSKVFSGWGVMEKNGLIAYATTGTVSTGNVTFTRVGPIENSSDDVVQYILYGV